MTRLGDALLRAYTRRDPPATTSGTPAGTGAETNIDSTPAEAVASAVQRTHEELRAAVAASKPTARSTAENWNWPAMSELVLSAASSGFQRLADKLRKGSLERGVCSIVFTGTGRDVGRTTVILSLARALHERFPTEPLLLIDADFAQPGLTPQVGLTPVRGLWELLQSELPAQSALHPGPAESGDQRLSLLPLSGPVSAPELESVGPEGLLPLLADLREEFPLILIDAGAWNPLKPPLWKCAGIDGLIHVQRHDSPSPGVLHFERSLCREMGIEFLGVIETFAPAGVPVAPEQQQPHHHLNRAARNISSSIPLR